MAKDQRHLELAEAIRLRRAALGLSQRELSAVAGVSKPSIDVIENARQTNYRETTLHKLGQALGWDEGELVWFMSDPDYELPKPRSRNYDPGGAEALESHPLELAALSGKIEQLSDDDRKYVEDLVNRLLDQD